MTTGNPNDPNAEQVRYWNETAAPRWVAQERQLDAQLRPLGERVMDRLAVAAGERVLDVGCGCGDTSLALARRVGSGGSVTGVDVSAPMLERARTRAREAGMTHVQFVQADGQTHRFAAGSHDVLFSRFGVMFFADPTAAFANLRAALRPGGRLGFVCWQALLKNPWMLVPLMAVAQHVTLPAPPAPDAPGPFSFADADRVRGILAGAGLADVAVEPLEETLTLGDGDLDATVEFLLHVGPAAAVLREAGPEVRPRVAAAVRDALAPFHGPAGARMASAAWIVTGRRS